MSSRALPSLVFEDDDTDESVRAMMAGNDADGDDTDAAVYRSRDAIESSYAGELVHSGSQLGDEEEDYGDDDDDDDSDFLRTLDGGVSIADAAISAMLFELTNSDPPPAPRSTAKLADDSTNIESHMAPSVSTADDRARSKDDNEDDNEDDIEDAIEDAIDNHTADDSDAADIDETLSEHEDSDEETLESEDGLSEDELEDRRRRRSLLALQSVVEHDDRATTHEDYYHARDLVGEDLHESSHENYSETDNDDDDDDDGALEDDDQDGDIESADQSTNEHDLEAPRETPAESLEPPNHVHDTDQPELDGTHSDSNDDEDDDDDDRGDSAAVEEEPSAEQSSMAQQFAFFVWNGALLECGELVDGRPVIALQCYTHALDEELLMQEMNNIDGAHEYAFIPELILLAASTGKQHTIVPPHMLESFLLLHADFYYEEHCQNGGPLFVCHDTAAEFDVIRRFLEEHATSEQVVDWWWEIANSGRLRSTAILDMLVRLAIRDVDPDPQPLGALVLRYLVTVEPEIRDELCRYVRARDS